MQNISFGNLQLLKFSTLPNVNQEGLSFKDETGCGAPFLTVSFQDMHVSSCICQTLALLWFTAPHYDTRLYMHVQGACS